MIEVWAKNMVMTNVHLSEAVYAHSFSMVKTHSDLSEWLRCCCCFFFKILFSLLSVTLAKWNTAHFHRYSENAKHLISILLTQHTQFCMQSNYYFSQFRTVWIFFQIWNIILHESHQRPRMQNKFLNLNAVLWNRK